MSALDGAGGSAINADRASAGNGHGLSQPLLSADAKAEAAAAAVLPQAVSVAVAMQPAAGGAGGVEEAVFLEKDQKTGNTVRRTAAGRVVARTQLPACFKGAAELPEIPFLEGQISNVTLPSRLELLGRRGFKILAALNPVRIGNAVLGFAPVWNCCGAWQRCGACCSTSDPDETGVRSQLFVLPSLFSRAHARIFLFLRILALLLFTVFVLAAANAANMNIGRAWAIGTTCSLFVMWRLSTMRRAPDGVMSFCRSMGVPETEELMFSYAWKTEKDNVRTLAKAMWDAGVGVWIDVVKLCPGDEIRPMVKTIVNRVHRVVVFLTKAYVNSPNCCVEMQECVQHPEKVIICVLEPVDDAVLRFLRGLNPLAVVYGFQELIPLLDLAVQDQTDAGAYEWWKRQRISGAGVPNNVVPSADWPVPKWSLTGSLVMPDKALDVGPWFLAGDLKSHGQRVSPPWLLLLALFALCSNFFDIWAKYTCKFDSPQQCVSHSWLDYMFLGLVGCCNVAPFFAWSELWDTRRDMHVALRPLLASRSLNGGVRVQVNGSRDDPVVQSLRGFLTDLGHLKTEHDGAPFVRVFVMSSRADRDAIFASDNVDRSALFVWSSKDNPFEKGDPIAQRMMRYLVLVSSWEKTNLAENLFSAIGIRVVDLLHSGKNS